MNRILSIIFVCLLLILGASDAKQIIRLPQAEAGNLIIKGGGDAPPVETTLFHDTYTVASDTRLDNHTADENGAYYDDWHARNLTVYSAENEVRSTGSGTRIAVVDLTVAPTDNKYRCWAAGKVVSLADGGLGAGVRTATGPSDDGYFLRLNEDNYVLTRYIGGSSGPNLIIGSIEDFGETFDPDTLYYVQIEAEDIGGDVQINMWIDTIEPPSDNPEQTYLDDSGSQITAIGEPGIVIRASNGALITEMKCYE